MGTAERRAAIIRILYRRRHETMSNLAREFGVSERTILRDIEILSLTEPIYTQCGRHVGGVYISDSYSLTKMYMSDEELSVLNKVLKFINTAENCLNKKELDIFKSIILQYSKPNNRKDGKYDKTRN